MGSPSVVAVANGIVFSENLWKYIFSMFVRSLDGVSTIRKIGLANKELKNLVDSDAELWQTAWDESGFAIIESSAIKDENPRSKYATAARCARALRSPQRWQMHSLHEDASANPIKAAAFNEGTLVAATTYKNQLVNEKQQATALEVAFVDLKHWPKVESTKLTGNKCESMNWTPMSSEWACDCEPSSDSVAGFLHIPTALSQSSDDATVEKRGITAPYKDSHYPLVMIPNQDGRYPFALVTSKDDTNRPMWVYNLQTKRYTHQFTLNVPVPAHGQGDEILFNGNWLLINDKKSEERGFKLFYIHYWDFGNFASAEELMSKSLAPHNVTNLLVYTTHKPRFVAVEKVESSSSYSIVDVELWGLNNWNFDSKVTEARKVAIRVPCGSGAKSSGCSDILSLTACANMIFMTDKDHLYVIDIESRCLVATLKLKSQDQSTQVAIVDSTLFVVSNSSGVIAVDLLARSSAATAASEKIPFIFSAADKLEAEKAAQQAETARKEAEIAAAAKIKQDAEDAAAKAAAEKKAQEEAAAAKAAAEKKAQEDAAAAIKKAREEAEAAAAAKAQKEAEERAAAAEAQAKKEAEEKAAAEAKKAQEEAAAAEKCAREEAEAKAAAELKAKREAEMALMEAKEREAAEARAREEDAAAAAAKKAGEEAEAAAEAQAKKEAEERAAAAAAEKKAREDAAVAAEKAKKDAEEAVAAAAAKAAAEKKAHEEAEAQAKEKAAHEAAARALAEKKAFEEAEAARHAENQLNKAKSFRSAGAAVVFAQTGAKTVARQNSVSALHGRSASGALLAPSFDLGDLDVSDPSNGTVAYSELVQKPEHLDRTKLESYLSDAAFKVVFAMTRSEFASMPKWKQDKAKRERDLF